VKGFYSCVFVGLMLKVMNLQLHKTGSLFSLSVALLSATLAALVGCDSAQQVAKVAGEVTFNGNKISTGTVTFYPLQGGRPSTGTIRPDGSYVLSTFASGDGALPGDYKVSIEAKSVTGAVPAPKSLKEEIAQASVPASATTTVTWLVPQQYSSAESSGLTATVGSGPNQIDFNLR
jgi:hypothetical protein